MFSGNPKSKRKRSRSLLRCAEEEDDDFDFDDQVNATTSFAFLEEHQRPVRQIPSSPTMEVPDENAEPEDMDPVMDQPNMQISTPTGAIDACETPDQEENDTSHEQTVVTLSAPNARQFEDSDRPSFEDLLKRSTLWHRQTYLSATYLTRGSDSYTVERYQKFRDFLEPLLHLSPMLKLPHYSTLADKIYPMVLRHCLPHFVIEMFVRKHQAQLILSTGQPVLI